MSWSRLRERGGHVHSGSVVGAVADELAGYETSKGAVRFAVDAPLADDLVRTLVTARLRELGIS